MPNLRAERPQPTESEGIKKPTPQQKWQERVADFARCRAHVLLAIHDQPGATYVEIRLWIHEHYRYWMENVGARCRELYTLGFARKELNGNRVHVYPIEK